ncbi:MAG: hypothetical protein WCG79_00860 [Verrucomicrobiota bacterium]|jgi:hypothetical protein
MNRAFKKLFSIPQGNRRWWSIIVWWELRRIPYNLAVGVIGIVNLAAFAFINDTLLKPYLAFENRDWEPLSVVLFAFAANFFYTSGWVTELIVSRIAPERARRFGPIAFGLGLGFTVLLTFLPPVADGIRLVWFASHKSS